MTRKEFVLQVTDDIMSNPRAVLAGHGLKAQIVQEIAQRPDVMAKLATILYSTKYAKKGAKGLKKANNLRIFGYKNFPEFNMQGREDVETFVGGLPAEDAAKFSNANNIVTILMLPATDEADEDIETKIISGPSVPLTFNTAVRKEYKINGGMYLTIMLGDSVARPAEEKIAKTKAKVNKRKQAKRSVSKVKAELKNKARKKLAIIDKKKAALAEDTFRTEMELEQFANITGEFGAKEGNARSLMSKMSLNDAAVGERKAAFDAAVAELDATGKNLLKSAKTALGRGNKTLANALLKELGSEVITDVLKNGVGETSGKMLDARKKKIRGRIKELSAKCEQLMVDLTLAPDVKAKNSVRSSLSRYTNEIKKLRAALGTYKNISIQGMNNKAKMLQEMHSSMETLMADGVGVKAALDASLAKLSGAKPEQKAIIKQQIIEQVAEGTPMQYAVQQAIQENVQEVVAETAGASLSSSSSVKDLLDSVI